VTERTAVVTGGAGGIGGAICESLVASGHGVVSLDLAECTLDGVESVLVDLSSADVVCAAAQSVLERFGKVSVLVHAAADLSQFDLAHLDLERWRRVQAVNVETLLLLAQAFVPGMTDKGFGRIVSVVSDTVWMPAGPAFLPYVASKSALVGVTRTLAMDLGAAGISVTAVAPGLTPTPAARAGVPDAVFDSVAQRQSMKRSLSPHDVGAAVAFLVSDAAAAMTGQTLCVNGGLTFH
jgi:NAD(P)-dependent dehydrogenase (short-subunit alcohol dehydrogenase family)